MPEDDRPTIDPERLYEMRAAFGPTETVVDVLTGEKIDLASGRVVVPADPKRVAHRSAPRAEAAPMMDVLDANDIIHTYTAQDAVADGALHHPYPERWPWLLISQNVHAACSADRNRAYDHALGPLLEDLRTAAAR